MIKSFITLCLSLLPFAFTMAQSIDVINIENKLAANASLYTNGYAQKLSGDDITYNNLWDTKDQAFLTRTTTGKVAIVWQSEPVKTIKDGVARFLLLICVDQANPSLHFDFYVNDKQVGRFINFHTPQYQISFDNGIQLNFERIGFNHWGDGACFMEVRIPQQVVQTGAPVNFKVVGENASANNWFMVFKNQKLVEEIVHRAKTDECFILNMQEHQVQFYAPDVYQNKQVSVRVNNGKEQKTRFTHKAGKTSFAINNVDAVKAIQVDCEGKTLFSIPDFKQYRDTTYLTGYTLTKKTREDDGSYVLLNTYSSALDYIKRISGSWWNNSNTYIMVSSHQDIAWMDTPYRCVEDRDKIIVSPALDLLEKHSNYRYDIEDVLILEEYLERNPRKRDLIQRLINNGQLGIGASYTQPYEEMQTGEALTRQFYYGKRFLTKHFNGYQPRTYWNVDVPGRTLQMPQILKKSGVEAMQYSRHERGLFNWISPDSSSVMVFTPGHYTVASQFLRKTPEEGLEKYDEYVESMPDYRGDRSKPAVIGMLSAEDMSPAHTYYQWIDKFNDFEKQLGVTMPNLQHSTSDMFFDALKKTHPKLPSIYGERPNLWLYIHGPGHERALTTYREANRKAVFAETFSTIASLLKGSFAEYPKRMLDEIWKDLIYADHGWGGNGGHVTDSLFHARYKHADTLATELSLQATQYIAGKIKFNPKQGTPVVVFNPLSVSYSSPVQVEINTQKYPLNKLSVRNAKGESIPFQVTTPKDGKAIVEFIAKEMPPIGYTTYYLSDKPAKAGKVMVTTESDFYSLVFENGKLKQIIDKEIQKELFDASKFEVAEIFTMQSVGNGAGEFATMQLPSMEGFEKTSGHQSKWVLQESGEVYSLYRSETAFKDATIVRYLKMYKSIKRIDFPSSILGFNGNTYREFRQAFALKSKSEVSYEVPYGTVIVGKDEMVGPAGERYMDETKDIHPRGIANWFGGNDGQVDVKLTSSVVVVDYIDPTESPVSNTILQPILFASRRSCHWLGEFYKQAGDHHFEFSLRSDKPGSPLTSLQSVAANYKPIVVLAPESYQNALLPEQLSFFSLDKDNLVVSALKKHEDKNDVVIRLYDAASNGKPTTANIRSYFPVKQVVHTDMLELNPGKASNGEITVENKAIETFSISVQ